MPRCEDVPSSPLGRSAVAGFDHFADGGAASLGGEINTLLDPFRLFPQRFILDRFAKPAGIVPSLKMIFPGRVIDAIGELEKEDQILRAEVELSLGAPEVE